MYDIIIIGAGVTGCSVARYLSRYQAKVCVVERADDVCCGTSKANSAIVHAGYDAAHGSLMAKMNVKGSQMMPALAKELDFPFQQNGSLVVCMHEDDMLYLKELYENGIKNGVKGLEIVGKERMRELEPNVSDDAVAALWAPTAGIVCPFTLTIALAENANTNGVDFKFNTEVTAVVRNGDHWTVQTNQGALDTNYVVNAAGLYADVFHNMVSAKKIHITPRRGDYFILDHATDGFVKHTVFQLPGKYGKGVLVAPTVHGNTIVGPTAVDIEDKEGTNTTLAGLDEVTAKADIAIQNIPLRQTITSFAGLRAHEDHHEFIIGEAEDAPHFIDCAGIESPGLSSSPAIGMTVADLLRDKMHLQPNPKFNGVRKGIIDPKTLSLQERAELIQKDPAYGQIVCRCESVTEGQILDAIHRPLGAKSIDGVKFRTRAGMGRCQAGFCTPRVIEILARELGVGQNEITKNGGASKLIVGNTKDRA
ncbi:FAD/NAD(P)-binding oxidoreductase [Ruminococcaceae bacterium CPB6]|nr:FAD/NAD(P)-binding oxidoreductase [Ruminococcaceae bacterium CPB6]